jgi:hypothetical protein
MYEVFIVSQQLKHGDVAKAEMMTLALLMVLSPQYVEQRKGTVSET